MLLCTCACTFVCAWSSIYLHGCLLHCRRSVPTGGGTASWCERLISWRTQTSKNALCLTKHYSSGVPSAVICRGSEIINELQIHRVMRGVTAPIGKLFLLTLHFFCFCFCLSQCFVLIIWSVTVLVHTAIKRFSCSYLCLHTLHYQCQLHCLKILCSNKSCNTYCI